MQGGHVGGVAGLLDADYDIVLLLHECLVKLRDVVGKLGGVIRSRIVPESREIHNLHVRDVRTLQPDIHRGVRHALAQLVVSHPHPLLHAFQIVLVPLVLIGHLNVPDMLLDVRPVPKLQYRGPPRSQTARHKIEGVPGEGLNEAGFAGGLRTNNDELRQREILGISQPVLHLCLHLTENIQQLAALLRSCHGRAGTPEGRGATRNTADSAA
mmetsp:Transcript_107213/g.245479  ORF Transcript_107213/g.245479 Transcript_107213/m.245479 type:complete len:212 (-) Transcript_107213:16-651(-)